MKNSSGGTIAPWYDNCTQLRTSSKDIASATVVAKNKTTGESKTITCSMAE